jgi:trk system potassium uptake protein TrkA
MALRMAHSLVVPNVIDYIGLSHEFSIIEVPAPAAFVGKSLREIDLRARHGLTLIAIKRRDATTGAMATHVAPPATETILARDVLAMVGSNDRLAALEQLIAEGQS